MEENNNLNLEKMNTKYTILKNDMAKIKEEIKDLNTRLEKLNGDIVIIRAGIENAKRVNNTNLVKDLQNQEKALLEQVKKVKELAEIRKEELTEVKGKIENIFTQLKEDPAMKQHIDQILAKRYDRENKKISEDIKQKENEKEKLNKNLVAIEEIKNLVNNHPTLSNNLKGILPDMAEINKLLAEQKELIKKGDKRTPDDDKRLAYIKNEIKARKGIVDKKKEPIMNYIKKNKLKITEEDIYYLANYTAIGKNGVDISKTISASVKGTNNKINNLDAEINKANNKYNINRQAIINLGQIPTEYNLSEGAKEGSKEASGSNGDRGQGSEEQPKWWQFIKRFKAWNKRRNEKQLGEGSITASHIDTKDGTYRESLKYDVVKGMVNSYSRDAQKSAKKDYRESNKDEDQRYI